MLYSFKCIEVYRSEYKHIIIAAIIGIQRMSTFHLAIGCKDVLMYSYIISILFFFFNSGH